MLSKGLETYYTKSFFFFCLTRRIYQDFIWSRLPWWRKHCMCTKTNTRVRFNWYDISILHRHYYFFFIVGPFFIYVVYSLKIVKKANLKKKKLSPDKKKFPKSALILLYTWWPAEGEKTKELANDSKRADSVKESRRGYDMMNQLLSVAKNQVTTYHYHHQYTHTTNLSMEDDGIISTCGRCS